ncbi:MAG: D-alanyl-D-alanine carboxypeptidase [Xanthobacteraceae bacterium]|jgi:D-alanyl-D-alanine carboxypeptidase
MGRTIRRVTPLLSAIVAIAALTSDPADARHRHHHARVESSHHHAKSEPSREASHNEPRYADIVVDANSGDVLHESAADSLRHPASLTKIMTLYLLFEQLEAGRIKLTTPLHVSEHASSQAPTKLGLKAGQSIEVEDAIKAIVTESANDMAVVVAETIGGDEDSFARLMTRKAHTLGMTRTVYVNASGLPAEEQLTTARDQAMLGRAIQERFPTYYRFFATATFHYHGRSMRNHNHLLGNVAGVDGIKTGYTQSSGFNLVTSVRRGNRHIVAVVLGGASGGARDARMRALIEQHIAEASSHRTAAIIAETEDAAAPRPKTATAEPAPGRPNEALTRSLKSDTTAAIAPRPGSAEPIQPIPVRTINVRPHEVKTAAIAPLVLSAPQSTVAPQWAARSPQPAAPPAPLPAQLASAEPLQLPPPAPRPGLLGTLPVRSAALAPMPEFAPPAPPPARPAAAASLMAHAMAAPAVETETQAPAAAAETTARGRARGDWMIQVGAFPDEGQAKERLKSAQSLAQSLLVHAEGFTEKVMKGSKELYRARFVGLDKDAAEAACHYFKRNDIACISLKN